MDTRDSKHNEELGRHQRVLDAYRAHPGAHDMPPAGLDAKLIALAASSINAASKAPQRATTFSDDAADGIKTLASKTSARSRRRRWPFALAASVATIGFAAILARTTFQSVPDEGAPIYQARSYETKSVAADQVPAADAPVADKAPTPLQEEMRNESRDQSASVAAMPPAVDKAKLSPAPAPDFERAAEQALGGLSAAPADAAPTPFDAGATNAADITKFGAEIDAAKSAADRAEPNIAQAPATASPALVPKPRPIVAAATSAPAASATPPEDSALEVQDMRSRRGDVDAAPIANMPADNAVAETAAAPLPASPAKANERGTVLTEEKPMPQASTEVQDTQTVQAKSAESAGLAKPAEPLMPRESTQSGASEPVDDAINAKKDEFATERQAGPANLHAKTYAAIRALRDQGQLLQAKAMLARFRKAYPQAVLPEDLRVLEKAK